MVKDSISAVGFSVVGKCSSVWFVYGDMMSWLLSRNKKSKFKKCLVNLTTWTFSHTHIRGKASTELMWFLKA